MRGSEGEELAVVGVRVLGAPTRPLFARRRAKRAGNPGEQPKSVPLTRLTAVPAIPFTDAGAARDWFDDLRDRLQRDAEVEQGLGFANRVIHAHRLASSDPYGHELDRSAVLAIRVGYGTGSEVAESLWTDARSLPSGPASRSRLDPDSPLAEMLAGRRPVFAGDDLLLRAKLDLDQGRDEQALFQARAAAGAMKAEGVEGAGGWAAQLAKASPDRLHEIVTAMLRASKRRMHHTPE